MGLIRRLGKKITRRFWRQGKIGLRVEMDSIEGRGAYERSQLKCATELIPPY